VTDHCPTAFGAGPDGLGEYHDAALALADGADVLVHDAQLLAEEVAAEAAFGHAAAEYAVGLARRAGAGRRGRGGDAYRGVSQPRPFWMKKGS
jgi:hypothetical protein